MSKIPLQMEPRGRGQTASEVVPIKSALPFYQSGPGRYWHRPRYMGAVYFKGKYSHTYIRHWCGMSGCLSATPRRGRMERRMSAEVDGPICALCEAKAIGAGMLGAAVINGREVIFTPRRP